MNVRFRNQFLKDLKKLKSKSLKQKISQIILHIEHTSSVGEIANAKTLKGESNYFRIRIGDYRLGFFYDKSGNEIWMERFLHRKEIYKKFP